MRFYGLDDTYILAMPIHRFWLIESNITRLCAMEDMRHLNVAISAASSEGYGNLTKDLTHQMGTTVKRAPKLDREGFNLLRNLGR